MGRVGLEPTTLGLSVAARVGQSVVLTDPPDALAAIVLAGCGIQVAALPATIGDVVVPEMRRTPPAKHWPSTRSSAVEATLAGCSAPADHQAAEGRRAGRLGRPLSDCPGQLERMHSSLGYVSQAEFERNASVLEVGGTNDGVKCAFARFSRFSGLHVAKSLA